MVLAVQDELMNAGFWNAKSRLPRAEVYWCALPQITMPGALGFFVHQTSWFDSLLCFEAGHIYIPKWVLLHGPWQRRGSLRDVVRHEYAHAIAHYYPALIQRSARFRTVFCGRYFDNSHEIRMSKHDCISSYAETQPCEDFAETFMFYLRHKGRLPVEFTSEAIKQKWQFVRDLAGVIESGGSRW